MPDIIALSFQIPQHPHIQRLVMPVGADDDSGRTAITHLDHDQGDDESLRSACAGQVSASAISRVTALINAPVDQDRIRFRLIARSRASHGEQDDKEMLDEKMAWRCARIILTLLLVGPIL